MKTYMLDTNICSYIMRRHPVTYCRFCEEVRTGVNIVISIITYLELAAGAKSRKASPNVQTLLDRFLHGIDGILDFDLAAADAAAEIAAVLAPAGKMIGFQDTLIAAHAIASGCICVTNNMREFARVPGLTCENWATAH